MVIPKQCIRLKHFRTPLILWISRPQKRALTGLMLWLSTMPKVYIISLSTVVVGNDETAQKIPSTNPTAVRAIMANAIFDLHYDGFCWCNGYRAC